MERQHKVVELFRQHGGQLRMKEAMDAGLSRRALYAMRDSGVIETVSRGVYRLAELAPLSDPELAAVALRYPNAVLCLISALSFHEITTQIPRAIQVAVSRNARPPALDYPTVESHRFSKEAFEAGIEDHKRDGITIRVYSKEKTLADCFKYRSTLGMEVVIEALKMYQAKQRMDVGELLRYARVCRVESIMRPYLEALL
ncbi:MAG: type IV toxin-antitoxin system AbiEi family antitoxin domain-containing protein [Deltaproteobacteria bacterium]|nr:type IV toxin-antitoxin system AbiEi family antitoxin domain-containing protein [Deltaproteobacteria bacterium]MBN2671402.1 type IV toxin-antitoxin system AbiEi family antitoxin domain-containing protein [Deltaproteobacteria bacterium]